jgi:hypothetical protein
MSYHILHQFDEQWLADLKQDSVVKKRKGFLDSFDDETRHIQRTRLAARESKRWAVVTASILLAAFALLYSIDASRRADALQRRLDTLEKTLKK